MVRGVKMKFNSAALNTRKTVNKEGAQAFSLHPEEELYSLVVTSSLSKAFYESANERISRLRSLVSVVDPLFVAQLAIYARTQMNLRSIPLVLAVELARVHRGDSLLGRLLPKVILRADEITELLAYFQQADGRTGQKKLGKLPNQMYRGLASAFHNFNEYGLAKYNRDTAIKLRDALFLCHAKPRSDEEAALYKRLIDGTMATPYTWETELSEVGQQKFPTPEAKALAFTTKWQELIDSFITINEPKGMGNPTVSKVSNYMALLRNLRNILEASVDFDHMTKLCMGLSDPTAVQKSKQFPFRFLSAYVELLDSTVSENSPYSGMALKALEDAVNSSADTIEGFDQNTTVFIAIDTSGSMATSISQKSSVLMMDIGFMLGMMLERRCKKVYTSVFAQGFKQMQLPKGAVLANAMNLRRRSGEVGHSTNGYLVLQNLITTKKVVDKVMFFTDCQLYDDGSGYGVAYGNSSLPSLWQEYKKIAPQAKAYFFDLAGYGTLPLDIRDNDVYIISGWNEKVFSVLNAIERGGSAIEEIKKISV